MNAVEPALDYRAFLESKVKFDSAVGFDVDPAELNPALKDHTRAMVRWALMGGRRALFAAFGLHKTCAQLEIMRLIGVHRPGLRLITLPLGVRQEFFRDARERFHGEHVIKLKFIRQASEIEDERTIYLTNYESVREGVLDIAAIKPCAVSLDEASILRGFGGTKTFRELMALFAGDDRRADGPRVTSEGVPLRFVATATPSPNEYIEILAYAAFLGIMDIGQAKTRFFKRNSEKADALTLHPHKTREFWLWVASWALFVQRPSDLGFEDAGYALPPLDVRWHELPSDHSTAGAEKDGQGRMFKNAAIGVQDAAREKRASLPARVARTLELVLHAAQRPSEAEGISAAVPAGVLPPRQDADGRHAAPISEEAGLHGDVPSGEQGEAAEEATRARAAAPVRHHADAARADADGAGLRVPDLPADAGIPDEGRGGSLARDGHGARHPVPELQRGAGPAGGQPGESGAGDRVLERRSDAHLAQVIVWVDLNDEQRALEEALAAAGVTYSSLYGSQPVEEREQLLDDWRARRTTVFLSKTSMYGAGVNLQQAHRMVFAGVHFKFYEVIQGVHRIQRFGQQNPCTCDFVYTEAEREVRRELERKWQQHVEQVATMTAIIREFGLSNASMAHALTRSIGVERAEASGEGWTLVRNDCVPETQAMAESSVGLIVTSIPFSHQYEYSPSYNDFGHTDDNEHFWRQMDFLTPHLLRVLQPGRVCAIHVKDRITPCGINGFGFQTVTRISDACADHFERHGFAFLGRKTIVTDVVRENNQTYRLGWSEQCKDGSRMGAGLPEYVMLFRKPPTDRSNGYADVPVVKDKRAYTRARWQYDAHGFMRSGGNRLLQPEDLDGLPQEAIFKRFRKHSLENVYDFARDLAIAEHVDRSGWLPSTFMLLPPASWHPDVWTDVARMRTLNSTQAQKGREMHLCPLQFDIVERLIVQFSMEGEEVYDPFAGLGTVPFMAVKLGRRGRGSELSEPYWKDSIWYLRQAEAQRATPSLFDMEEAA